MPTVDINVGAPLSGQFTARPFKGGGGWTRPHDQRIARAASRDFQPFRPQ